MRVRYAPRAIRDLAEIASYYRNHADENVAAAVGRRLEHVVGIIAQRPELMPRLNQRSNVRVALVLRYPYKIFYRLRGDVVEILHIRHTARRPWLSEGSD
jgi:toxin ParE1/3/4